MNTIQNLRENYFRFGRIPDGDLYITLSRDTIHIQVPSYGLDEATRLARVDEIGAALGLTHHEMRPYNDSNEGTYKVSGSHDGTQWAVYTTVADTSKYASGVAA